MGWINVVYGMAVSNILWEKVARLGETIRRNSFYASWGHGCPFVSIEMIRPGGGVTDFL